MLEEMAGTYEAPEDWSSEHDRSLLIWYIQTKLSSMNKDKLFLDTIFIDTL